MSLLTKSSYNMLFNSTEFVLFFATVFIIYWSLPVTSARTRNFFLLMCSYVFYGWWDWRFLFLLVFVSLFNFAVGVWIQRNSGDRKGRSILVLGVMTNIAVLITFKYLNFLIQNVFYFLSFLGCREQTLGFSLVYPLGLSFYIFLSISYIVDVYHNKFPIPQRVTQVLLSFGFFPIVLAGPIQRPSLLLPQLSQNRDFNYEQACDGAKQILWGLFAKVVVADNCGVFVDQCFLDLNACSGSKLLLGAMAYSVQIYADFSGYSNIAIGVARLLGFELMRNFSHPYFSRSLIEFWKRWHMSLTSWIRDYVYLPLAYSVARKVESIRSTRIKHDTIVYVICVPLAWLLMGLWHGANYTYVIWGLIHAFFLILYRLSQRPRRILLRTFHISNNNAVLVAVEGILTMVIVTFAWIVFRANNLREAYSYLSKILSDSLYSFPSDVHGVTVVTIVLSVLFLFIEWLQRNKEHALQIEKKSTPLALRWAFYYAIVLAIIFFGGNHQPFIYSQF